MLMLGLYVTGEIPFKAVYIHGYVLAEDGAKMSKSLVQRH
jgi:valyl-tRNA synthetase